MTHTKCLISYVRNQILIISLSTLNTFNNTLNIRYAYEEIYKIR